jgi:hypothetical protein
LKNARYFAAKERGSSDAARKISLDCPFDATERAFFADAGITARAITTLGTRIVIPAQSGFRPQSRRKAAIHLSLAFGVSGAIGAQINALARKRLRREPKPIISAQSRGVWSR